MIRGGGFLIRGLVRGASEKGVSDPGGGGFLIRGGLLVLDSGGSSLDSGSFRRAFLDSGGSSLIRGGLLIFEKGGFRSGGGLLISLRFYTSGPHTPCGPTAKEEG